MTDEILEIRKSYWKSTRDRRMVSCQQDDPGVSECEIEVVGTRASRLTIRRGDRELRMFNYEIENVTQLLYRAFEQGRYRQAAIVRRAINLSR
mgnify:CR=1 FL=1